MANQLPCEITIGRNSRDVIGIEVMDARSRQLVARIEMTPADFAMALTGLAHIEATYKHGNLSVVGMKKVSETRSIEYVGDRFAAKDVMVEWLKANAAEEGWSIDSYLGSQNSVVHRDDKTLLNYRVFKYVQEA